VTTPPSLSFAFFFPHLFGQLKDLLLIFNLDSGAKIRYSHNSGLSFQQFQSCRYQVWRKDTVSKLF